MTDKPQLLIKGFFGILGVVAVAGIAYFTFDDMLWGIGLGIVAGGLWLYPAYHSTFRLYHDPHAEVIYRGYDLKGQIIYILVALGFLYFQNDKANQYLALGFTSLSYAIGDGYKFIVFDFTRRKISGLFDVSSHSFENLTIEGLEDGMSTQIKVTDKEGFYVVEKEKFSEEQWDRVVGLLGRVSKG